MKRCAMVYRGINRMFMSQTRHPICSLVLSCLLIADFSALAFSAADANTIFSAFNSTFYYQNGTNGYFKDSQTDGSANYFWSQAEMI